MKRQSADAREPQILRRRPSRARGHRRVEDLLRAASDVFVEKGFDAATMTEIASRAGASIGSLYQFFPTKDAIADTLRAASGDFLCKEWGGLRDSEGVRTPQELASALLAIGDKMLAEFPSFVPLVSFRRGVGENISRVRANMSQALNSLLQSRMAGANKTEVETTGIIIREMMRCQVDIKAINRAIVRKRALAELEAMLAHYLEPKLNK